MPIKSRRSLRATAQALIFACAWLTGHAHLAHASAAQPTLITLAPHLTELAYTAGAGEHLVGVVEYSNWPEAALALPRIGDAFRFDMEAIVSLDPKIALAWRGGTPQAVADQLAQLGVEVVWIDTQTLEDIKTALEHIGQVAGTTDVANTEAKAYADELARWQNRALPNTTSPPVRVFYQIADRPLYTFGGRHVINEVLATCHADNVFGDLDTEALSVDPESVLAAQPDLILSGHEPSDSNGASDPLEVWTPHLDGALADTTLVSVDPNLLVRPTPRIVQGIETLCRLTKAHQEAP